MDNKVLCYACKKPIHIDDFGMVTATKVGKQKWLHDNYVCLVAYVMEKKEEENGKI